MNQSPWLNEIRPEKIALNVFELGISFWFVSTIVLISQLEENLYFFSTAKFLFQVAEMGIGLLQEVSYSLAAISQKFYSPEIEGPQ